MNGRVPLPDLLAWQPTRQRRILCIFPRYAKAFGTFNHAFPLMGDVRGFMPPQGILLLVSLLPRQWEVRFVDENIGRAEDADFEWADAVFLSGMHIQRDAIMDLHRRARRAGKITVLGGPSVSAAPEFYPRIDFLHCGEVGDATLDLFRRLDESIARPPAQVVFKTVERLPLQQIPSPAYDRINITQYLLGSVQFSSGCPYTCEFCDIPALYGRNPRYKQPAQIIEELELLARGGTPSVYFVDDNFIANPKATAELLPLLIDWQKKWDYTVRLSCEATLNITQHASILEMMREAGFTNIFCGIETPEPAALTAMKKRQNLRSPILEAVETLNRYGMEVASGIIMGLDTDTDQTAQALIDFAEASQIPIMTVNLLYALPHTPLYDRLVRDGRISTDPTRESNVEFLRPYGTVVADWRRVVRHIYEPSNLYRRYTHQAIHTYPHRAKPVDPLRQASPRNIRRALGILRRLVWRVGIQSHYRRQFWRMTMEQLSKGQVENVFQIAMVAHHLITYAEESTTGKVQASNYSAKRVDDEILEPAA